MNKKKNNKQLLWALISLLLAVMSVWAVMSQSKDMSMSDLFAALLACHPGWLILAVICMFGYIAFEGIAIWYLLRHCGYNRRVGQGILYASSDIYCAAITPSATGGQPVCAWFMLRDGIPMGFITAILALYLIAHTFATLVIGFLTVLLNPTSFGELTLLAKLLVILGYLTVTGLAVLFVCLLKKAAMIQRVGNRIIDWLTRKGWVKQTTYWKNRLAGVLEDYSSCLTVIKGKERILVVLFALTLLQRLSQTVVPALVYLAQEVPLPIPVRSLPRRSIRPLAPCACRFPAAWASPTTCSSTGCMPFLRRKLHSSSSSFPGAAPSTCACSSAL